METPQMMTMKQRDEAADELCDWLASKQITAYNAMPILLIVLMGAIMHAASDRKQINDYVNRAITCLTVGAALTPDDEIGGDASRLN
jgi:hypothetical protein